MLFKRIFVTVALSALCLIAIAPAAHASSDSVAVRIDDLDPNTEDGAARLLRRIERAAREVCGEAVARRYVSQVRAYRRCAHVTMARAVDQVGAAPLRTAFMARYGHI